MGWTLKEENLDIILVPTGVFIMCVYHLYLLYRYHHCPEFTSIGYENRNKEEWVREMLKLEGKDRGFAVSVLSSQLSASNNLSSISLVLCSLIGAIIGKSTDDLLASSFIFGDTSKSTNSIKYVAILSCFILAFACFIQTTRHLVHASFLISIPTYKPTGNPIDKPTAKPNGKPVDQLECIQKAVLRGSNFWTAGLRALYFATTLILWIFGPIPMLVGSVATVMILHFLDLHNGDYIPYDQNKRNGNGHLLVNKTDQDSTPVVVNNGRYNETLCA